MFDLFGDAELTVDLGTVTVKPSNLNAHEKFVITLLAQRAAPELIFEIGTYDGATTLALAAAAPDARIVTLDLPPDGSTVSTEVHTAAHVQSGMVGSRFRTDTNNSRITQVLGDSRTFDFSPWFGKVGLVFVDAGHEYEFVRADTETARKLVAPDGMIVWDDYDPGWPGVVRAVDESGLAPVLVRGTALAVHHHSIR